MKYIRTYESFKEREKINEEILGLGKLFKNLGKKLSLGFSKMFGTAGVADKIIEEYKKERISIENEKTSAVKALAEFLKSQKDGAQKDDTKKKELENNLTKQSNLYTQKLDLVRKKFDLKLKDATEEEKNEKIKNYINLKKIEMELEFVSNELKIVQEDLGLTEDIIKRSQVFQDYMETLNKKATEGNKKKEEEASILKGGGSSDKKEDPGAFNLEEAKKNKEYIAKNSQFAKGVYKFNVGEEIKIFITQSDNKDIETFEKNKEEYKGTTAFVFARKDEDENDRLRIAYKSDAEQGQTFTISKGKVITTKKIQEQKEKEKQAKEAQQKKEEQA